MSPYAPAFPVVTQKDENGNTIVYAREGLSNEAYITIEMAKALVGRKDSMIFSKEELACEAKEMAHALMKALI